MSLKLAVGDLIIHRIIEQETTFLPALELLPTLTPELLAENRPWLQGTGALDSKDLLVLCFQSYVVKTPYHTILIDSCIGNDKPRPQRPNWNMKTDNTYMRMLATAGFAVEDIDFVMCTHLHPDHVGWNTRLEGDRWIPTFPNARYIFGKHEFDHWNRAWRTMALFENRPDVLSRPLDIVQIALACVLGYADFRFTDCGWRKAYPNLDAFNAKMLERPSIKISVPPQA